MLQYLNELINIAIPTAGSISIFLYPMWKTRDVSRRFVLFYLIGTACFVCAMLLIVKRFVEIDTLTIQIFKFAVMPPAIIMQFIVFRKRVWQNVFLNAVGATITTVWIGVGMFVGGNWFADNILLAANIVSLAVVGVTLPPLLFVLRRLYVIPDMKQAVIFWRFAWIVPTAFFAIIMFASGYFGGNYFGSGFIIIRVVLYVVLLCICYLFEIAVRQISATEAARHEAKEFARKADFYRKMSHALRTPLTKISTNIQIAGRQDVVERELLDKSQEEIMRMAQMIDDALEGESESGAPEPLQGGFGTGSGADI